ncbi:DUF4350 domain-containing protein [Zafaria sp. Z1313]|uniref:DUF4350 domain-containing protein n=1 Tax=unclassified Zafaria TaxID=2828765 RepID=UPI002E76E6B6|nr:DUF4350 domain-containing protein [Zafaria sp. J156]MEE1620319.1 DUF4350 domain-containing protein [Zafaria sp. J156]
MSAVDERLERSEAPEAARTVWRRRWLASRWWLAVVAVACVVGLAFAVLQSGTDRRPLSPGNPAPDGAMAVAQVLGRHGVDVVVPSGHEAALQALHDAGDGGRLLLDDPDGRLNRDQLRALAGAAGSAVLVAPGFAELREFAPGIRPAGLVPEGAGTVAAGCALADAAEAGTAAPGGQLYDAERGCFPHRTAGGTAFSYAVDGTTTVLGDPGFLANSTVLAAGHPALALRTLGASPTLVWFQPTAADVVRDGPAPSPFALLPDWFTPVAVWLLVTGGIAVLWRARRDGPLVEEPLPVVVPASETAEGRARLYQDARAVDAAVAALRAGALQRLAERLRLGPRATVEGVVAALSKAGHGERAALRSLLDPVDVSTESRLTAWAHELHTLESRIGKQ